MLPHCLLLLCSDFKELIARPFVYCQSSFIEHAPMLLIMVISHFVGGLNLFTRLM